MYAQFYGLKEKPFSLLPDPDFLYLSDEHRTALDLLELAVLNQSGFCLLSGEIGAGKTTLIRELLNRLDENVAVGLVSNTHPSFGELFQWVMAAYGLQCENLDRIALHNQFIDYVIQNYAKGKRTLLIIDEAQNLSTEALEELRMLSNVNSGKDMVLQVMLVGQQQLRDKLRQPNLEQFVQRIGVEFHLNALSEVETREYIHYRIRHAGGSAALFSDTACEAIYQASMGVPRLINRICDLALVYAFSEQRDVVESAMIRTVVVDQQVGNVLEAARTCKSTFSHTETDVREQAADMPIERLDPLVVSGEGDPETLLQQEPILIEPAAITSKEIRPDSHTLTTAASTQDMAGNATRDVPATASAVIEHPEKISELHRLVVEIEKQSISSSGSGRRKRNMKLAFALSVILGGVVTSGWLSRDIWSDWVVGDWYRTAQARLRSLVVLPGTILSREPAVQPVERTAVDLVESIRQTGSAGVVDPAQGGVGKLATEGVEISHQSDTPPHDETAVKQKQYTIEKTVATPVPDPAIADEARRRELERLARLEEESRRLERERRTAERKFAEELKERHALEQKARKERERMLAAKAAVERAVAERQRVEQAAITPPLEVPSEGLKTPDDVEPGPIDSQRSRISVDEERLILPLAQGEPPLARHSGAAPDRVPDSSSATGFQSNPCDGPTARFMSTCISREP